MSNITLHPESVHFLVDMRDEWEIPGTICASVTVFGSHGMSKLHVCVYCIIFSLGCVIFNGEDTLQRSPGINRQKRQNNWNTEYPY